MTSATRRWVLGPAAVYGWGGRQQRWAWAAAGAPAHLPAALAAPHCLLPRLQLTALGEVVGTVSKGISQGAIDALPSRQYYEVAGTAAGEEEQCPICRHARAGGWAALAARLPAVLRILLPRLCTVASGCPLAAPLPQDGV